MSTKLNASANTPYPKGKRLRKVTANRKRLDRLLLGKVPHGTRQYVEAARNALVQAEKRWK